MFGNDPQCRAPNSGRRKVWSTEGIKQPLQVFHYALTIHVYIFFENIAQSFAYSRRIVFRIKVSIKDPSMHIDLTVFLLPSNQTNHISLSLSSQRYLPFQDLRAVIDSQDKIIKKLRKQVKSTSGGGGSTGKSSDDESGSRKSGDTPGGSPMAGRSASFSNKETSGQAAGYGRRSSTLAGE